jgi:hypothetical protein
MRRPSCYSLCSRSGRLRIERRSVSLVAIPFRNRSKLTLNGTHREWSDVLNSTKSRARSFNNVYAHVCRPADSAHVFRAPLHGGIFA